MPSAGEHHVTNVRFLIRAALRRRSRHVRMRAQRAAAAMEAVMTLLNFALSLVGLGLVAIVPAGCWLTRRPRLPSE